MRRSKIKIRKNILKNKEINQKIKTYLLKNLNELIFSLENNHNHTLIMRSKKGYNVTEEGIAFIRSINVWVPDEEKTFRNLPVWTKPELEKLAHKRGIKI